VFFGPVPAAGKEANAIYTPPGKPWVLFFRFYRPEKAVLDKTWRLGEVEET
jgi:hypothetical protein